MKVESLEQAKNIADRMHNVDRQIKNAKTMIEKVKDGQGFTNTQHSEGSGFKVGYVFDEDRNHPDGFYLAIADGVLNELYNLRDYYLEIIEEL